MMQFLKILFTRVKTFAEKYPVVLAALVIYLYYLLTSFDFFKHHDEKQTLLDYIMQFDSLFFLWLAAAAFLQLQKMRKGREEEKEHRNHIERVLDRQKIYGELVSDITMLLQDNVNNPLAIISVTTQEIRRRFESDKEILRWLDRIDGAMQRIHNTIRDLQAYEAQKHLEATNEGLKEKTTKEQ